jgi:hypothetical protein
MALKTLLSKRRPAQVTQGVAATRESAPTEPAERGSVEVGAPIADQGEPRRYLVIGLAKTGTTVISKTIQNSAGIRNYYLEPKSIAFFESLGEQTGDGVVKILFDHWDHRRRLLNAIVHNELATNFEANIFITRDPRAELISRLNYVAFPYFLGGEGSAQDARDWVDLFRRKENDPTFTLRTLVGELQSRFGVQLADTVATVSHRYAAYVGNLAASRKILIRYEDFLASRLDDHPLGHLFSGSREVGDDLQRTRRSGDSDDWRAFVTPSDLAWLNETLAASIDALGYRRDVETGGTVDPENCSLYVERIIAEAMAARTRSPTG